MVADSAAEKKVQKILLRPSSLVTILFLAITAIALAYIAGVMSGRHGGLGKPVAQVTEAPASDSGTVEPEKILAPEELNFARVLKEQAVRPTPVEEPEGSASSEFAQGEATDMEAPASESPASGETGQMFDFLFQMAAFRDEVGADNLRQRLEGAGYRTILQKNGKMLVVLVRLRGQEPAERELRELAASMRLGQPLLKQKKPVPR